MTITTNRIREFRERARLTQEELSKLLDVAETDVSRYETGARALTPSVIGRLARAFKIESWELFLDRQSLRRLAGRTAQGEWAEGAETQNGGRPVDRVERHDAEIASEAV